jgi:2-hydroxymuconate-semialdehyde hydrolase
VVYSYPLAAASCMLYTLSKMTSAGQASGGNTQIREEPFEFEGIAVAVYRGGAGPPIGLLHGSGPGASSIGNWRTVLGPLAESFEVFAMDLVGFGKSGRKPGPPYFDYPLWLRQAAALLARIQGERVGVIGHSLSASLALALAAREPRVAGVVTTGAIGLPFEPTDATRRTWRCPRDRKELVAALRGLIKDDAVIDEDYLRAREAVILAPGYAEYFDAMFQGDAEQYIEAAVLDRATLERVACPVLLMHGRDDQGFPPAVSTRLAGYLRDADLVLLSECSHSVAFERTTTFLALAREFFARHLTSSQENSQ